MATAPQLDTNRFETLLLDFLAYLEFERGLSRNTLEAYRSDLLQLGAHLKRTEVDVEPDEGERIQVRHMPLAELDSLIRDCRDAKTLVGLLWLKTMLD